MKLTKTSKRVLISIAVLALFTNIAMAIPEMPHQFYGEVSVNGHPAPDTVLIDARIESTVVSSAFVKEGKYGYEQIFYVIDPDGDREGDLVEFYINDVKAAEYTFVNGESTRLDLSVTIPNFCGDTVCESGESCSTCSGDCGACAPPPADKGSS